MKKQILKIILTLSTFSSSYSQANICQFSPQSSPQDLESCLIYSLQKTLALNNIPFHEELGHHQRQILNQQIEFALNQGDQNNQLTAYKLIQKLLTEIFVKNPEDFEKIQNSQNIFNLIFYIFNAYNIAITYRESAENKKEALMPHIENDDKKDNPQNEQTECSVNLAEEVEAPNEASKPLSAYFITLYDDEWEEYLDGLDLNAKEKEFFLENLRGMTLQYFVLNSQNQDPAANMKTILQDIGNKLGNFCGLRQKIKYWFSNRKERVLGLAREIIQKIHDDFFAITFCQRDLNEQIIRRIQYDFKDNPDPNLIFKEFAALWRTMSSIELSLCFDIDKAIKDFFNKQRTIYVSPGTTTRFIMEDLPQQHSGLRKYCFEDRRNHLTTYIFSYVSMLKGSVLCRSDQVLSLVKSALGEGSNKEILKKLSFGNGALKDLED